MTGLNINQKLGSESLIDFRELGITIVSGLYAPEIALAAARETVDGRYFERFHKLPNGVDRAAKVRTRNGLRQTATDVVAHRLRRNGGGLGLRLDPERVPQPAITALELGDWPGLVHDIGHQAVALAALRGRLLVETPDRINFSLVRGEAIFINAAIVPNFKVTAAGRAGIGLLVAGRVDWK